MRVATYCLAGGLLLNKLQKDLLSLGRKISTPFQTDVLHENLNHGDVFYFKNGTVVFWAQTKLETQVILNFLKDYLVEPNIHVEHDQFVVQSDSGRIFMEPQGYFNVDIIHLEEDTTELRMALSYPLSQSSKLQYFEKKIESFSQQYSPLMETLAKYGKVSRSSRNISKIIGQLFLVKTQVNLTHAFLNPPHFFWQNVNFGRVYEMVHSYMDIPERVAAINQKMDVLNEMLDMLNSQMHHQHGFFLEIIIIVLLCAEIGLGVLPWVVH